MKPTLSKKLFIVVDEEGFSHALVRAYNSKEAHGKLKDRAKKVNTSYSTTYPGALKRVLFGKDGVSIL